NYPRGMALDPAGNIYVSDISNNRIQKFTSAGVYLTQWGALGAGNGQFDNPYGVATDLSGNIYVVDTNNGRIEKFVASAPVALVSDVGGDQGRQTQIRFLRTSADAPSVGVTISSYEIYRRIDPLPGPAPNVGTGAPSSYDAHGPNTVELAGWTYLTTVPAAQAYEYNVVVPTLIDATAALLECTAFLVRAATGSPFTFYDSGAENGFSIDNLPP